MQEPSLRESIRRRLQAPMRDVQSGFESRAAIALIIRIPEDGGAEVLFVRRAEVEGDPWSGHMALPGGREETCDLDLLETAQREIREETSIQLERDDFIGRLADVPPATPTLPPILVRPFVAWLGHDAQARAQVHENEELSDHVWIPVADLSSPIRRSVLVPPETPGRSFPTIEYEDHTIWGLTFRVVESFLSRTLDAWTPDAWTPNSPE